MRATWPDEPVQVTKVSVIGGCSIVVPEDVAVEVTGFSLIGGTRIDGPQPTTPTHTLRIRHYGVLGGVSITRRSL